MSWLVTLGLVCFVVFVLVSAEASRRILLVRVEKGRIVSASGRAPAELFTDVEDVLARSSASGRLLLRLESGRVVVHAWGAMARDQATMQRLRNVVGRFPVARLRTARRVKR